MAHSYTDWRNWESRLARMPHTASNTSRCWTVGKKLAPPVSQSSTFEPGRSRGWWPWKPRKTASKMPGWVATAAHFHARRCSVASYDTHNLWGTPTFRMCAHWSKRLWWNPRRERICRKRSSGCYPGCWWTSWLGRCHIIWNLQTWVRENHPNWC